MSVDVLAGQAKSVGKVSEKTISDLEAIWVRLQLFLTIPAFVVNQNSRHWDGTSDIGSVEASRGSPALSVCF
ncbi:hypothetical protein L596_021614 [Steinernema carpocapsae]|uniref:Uncharacterized protein n=1 Tax=Steinernema carpocapsae TaxID=34508 RepID=A0A4U5MK34_STECR|nr:hypothetical protein L596_021614 [Steinernema carpocapsae]